MGPTRVRPRRDVHALLAVATALLAVACGGSGSGNAPDCPVPASGTETVSNAPASCEDDPGGVGY